MMDQVRADRDRRMVLDPSTWPLPYLPMKNVTGINPRTGVIQRSEAKFGSITLRSDNNEVHIFENIEDLIAAGWTVD